MDWEHTGPRPDPAVKPNLNAAGSYVHPVTRSTEISSDSRSAGFRRRRRILAWLIVAAAAATLSLGWLLPDIGDAGKGIGLVNWLSFAIRAFTPHSGIILLLLLLPFAVARAWQPAAALAVLAGVCILALLGMGRGAAVSPSGNAPSLTVMTVNVMYGRVRDADLLAEIDRHAPDVVILQEYTPAVHMRIFDAMAARLPHSSIETRDDAYGMALFSKLPFIETPVSYPAFPTDGGAFQPTEPQIRAVVRVGNREVVVQGVHTLPAISPSYLAEQRELCRALAAYALIEPRNLVLAGDFNHTPASMPAAWLRDAGLVDTHAVAGTGRGLTWPAEGLLQRLAGFRLDQVLISEGLSCGWCRVGNDVGSDHRPVIVRIVLR